jgi:Na+-translocating ferredoxin:NAD+ oxidoreductase subunit B
MQMKDIYQRLAEFLDTMPQRYPTQSESGIHCRILKHIFTAEDAEMVMKLKAAPEAAAEIAARIGAGPEEMEKTLYDMSRKGLIYRTGKPGSYRYMASAFLVGIFEFQMNRMTPDFARDMEEFAPLLFDQTWMKGRTRDLRTIPIFEGVDSQAQVMPYENAEQVIRSAKHIAVSDCMCRKLKGLIGEQCSRPSEVCFHFGSGTHFFVENGLARYIGQAEALDILKKGVEASLVCQMSSSQNPGAMCMCCDCCCEPLRAFQRLSKPAEMINSSFFARVREDDCTGCELCRDRCPMRAVSIDHVACVNLDRCIGCGVCAVSCPVDAIKVVRKGKDREFVPEKDLFAATMAIYKQRREG